jgi:RimJ/RimL family protein N-acetyltransferase
MHHLQQDNNNITNDNSTSIELSINPNNYTITTDPFPGEAEALKLLYDASFPIKYGNWYYESINARWYEGNPLFSVVARDFSGNVIGGGTACMQDGDRLDNLINKSNRCCYVLTLAVVPEWRRRGIAKELMTEITKWSKLQPQCQAIYLHVIHYNISAMNLYESLGLQQIRREENFYPIDGQNFDAFMYAIIFQEPVPGIFIRQQQLNHSEQQQQQQQLNNHNRSSPFTSPTILLFSLWSSLLSTLAMFGLPFLFRDMMNQQHPDHNLLLMDENKISVEDDDDDEENDSEEQETDQKNNDLSVIDDITNRLGQLSLVQATNQDHGKEQQFDSSHNNNNSNKNELDVV